MCPYDNSVAEATFNLIKTEFVHRHHFRNLEELKLHLSDYVHWFNNLRLHSTLDYLNPVDYKKQKLIFCPKKCCHNSKTLLRVVITRFFEASCLKSLTAMVR